MCRQIYRVLGLIMFALVNCQLAIGSPDPGIQFIENKGQWGASVQYAARAGGGHLVLSNGTFYFQFLDQQQLSDYHHSGHGEASSELPPSNCFIQGANVSVSFLGANPTPTASAFQQGVTYYNFFQGNDPSMWASNARAFGRVHYSSIYAGVDLQVYSVDESLKYDLVVQAGHDASVVRMKYDGVEPTVLKNGDLLISTSVNYWVERKPVAYQLVNGFRVDVACEFHVEGDVVSFCFPNGYDPCEELVIDPLLIFSTYSGSGADSWGSTATPGEHGMLYSSGVTNHFVPNAQGNNVFSGTFPVTPGAFQTSYGGLYDVAILKYDSIGRQLLYASYLGGSQSESSHSLIMNSNNELVVLGTTSSDNFPTTTSAFDRTFNGGFEVSNVVTYANGTDIFVAKVKADGTALLGSTFLGGASNDGVNESDSELTANYGDELRGDIVTDLQGNIYISSVTASPDFPKVAGRGANYGGGETDALVAKLSGDLGSVLWSNFLGGAGADASHTIKLSSTGDLYVAGGTTSANFPTAGNSYAKNLAGEVDGWIGKLSGDGQALLNTTFTGTVEFDQVYFLDLNASDEVFVYGQTEGVLPITPGVYHNTNSGQFLQKFSADLSQLKFSTVFGSGRGIPDISPTAFLVNDCNNIYMTGWGGRVNSQTGGWQSNTLNMPISSDAYQSTSSGSDFYFIVLKDDATEFLYGTYMGGSQSATHVDGGTSRFDKSGIVYHAVCSGCRAFNTSGQSTSDFPTTAGAWSQKNKSVNCNNAAFKFDLSSLRARIVPNSVKLNKPGLKQFCFPDPVVFQNKSTGGEIFEWDLGDGSKINVADTVRLTHAYKEPGFYTVKLKALDQGTCIGVDSTSVTIEVTSLDIKVMDDLDVCFGSTPRLSVEGGVSFEWQSEDKTFTSNERTPIVSPKDTTTYFVTVSNNRGCVVKDTVHVNVVPGVDLKFSFDRIFDCAHRPVLTVLNESNEKDADRFIFDFGDGMQSEEWDVEHTYERDGLYSVRLLGRKEFCVYEKIETVPIYTITAPNVITPGDKDGKNDQFKISVGDPPVTASDRFALRVYNRWGNEVFSTDSYQNQWAAEGLESGVYFYELKREGETICKSWVHVIK